MARDWIDEYEAAWATRDGATIAAFMAEDAEYVDVTLGEGHTGRAEIATFIDRMSGDLSSDYTLEITEKASSADFYWAEWALTGTHDGSYGPIPATGKTFAIRGVSVGRRRDGMITSNRDYWDMASFLTQVGALPTPG